MKTKAKAAMAAKTTARVIGAMALSLVTLFILFGLMGRASAMDIKQVKSPGGIEAWLVESHQVPLVSIRFAFHGGSTQDPEGKPGVANFVSGMLDEGAGDLVSATFQERMEDIAMRMQFEDSRDTFYGDFTTLTKYRDEAVELLKLALTKPRFDQEALDRIRRQLLANLAYESKSPERLASRTWYETAFKGHAYGLSPTGTDATIASITREDLEAFRTKNFAKSNLKVAVVGDIDEATLGKLLDDVFGDLPEQAQLNELPEIEPKKGNGVEVVEMDVPQSVAVFGMGGLKRKDPDFMAGFVLNHIIGGGGFSAILMEEVREKRGLAYSVYSYLSPMDHAAVYLGSVATKNDSIAESLEIIRSELARIAKDGVSEDDLKNAKSYLTGSYALRFDTNSKIASQLLGIMVEDMGIDYIKTRNADVDALTVEDLKRAAKRFLAPEGLLVVVVGKPTGLKGI
ncbi:MAG: insulinase family protein [Alphaproteobacteria bacterium]|nr:insulinase family protein [Alphaproteobacteria bacterium]